MRKYLVVAALVVVILSGCEVPGMSSTQSQQAALQAQQDQINQALLSLQMNYGNVFANSFVTGGVFSQPGAFWSHPLIVSTQVARPQDVAFGQSGVGIYVTSSGVFDGSIKRIWRTTNGSAWSAVTDPWSATNNAVELWSVATDGAGKWIVTASVGATEPAEIHKLGYSSDNGATWSDLGTFKTSTSYLMTVAYGNGLWVVIDGVAGILYTASDPSAVANFTQRYTYSFGTLAQVKAVWASGTSASSGLWALPQGDHGKIATSLDGITWTQTNHAEFGTEIPIIMASGNGTWVAATYTGTLYYSSDNGTTFTKATSPFGATNPVFGLQYGQQTFVALTAGGYICKSVDFGHTWGVLFGDGKSNAWIGSPTSVTLAFTQAWGYNGRFYAPSFDGTSQVISYSDWQEAGVNNPGMPNASAVLIVPNTQAAVSVGTYDKTNIIGVNAASGGTTVTLPSDIAGNAGRFWFIGKVDSGTDVVTISPTIDGVTRVLLSRYDSILIFCDGVAYHKMGNSPQSATEAEWTAANPTLAIGAMGIASDFSKHKIGDGSTAWNSLPYIGFNIVPDGSRSTTRLVTSTANTGGTWSAAVGIPAYIPVGATAILCSAQITKALTTGLLAFEQATGITLSDITASNNYRKYSYLLSSDVVAGGGQIKIPLDAAGNFKWCTYETNSTVEIDAPVGYWWGV